MATPRKQAPARTPEVRENQLISLAMDLVEQRIQEGTASAQETTHFLKLGTVREQLERQKIVHEIEALRVKSEQMAAGERREEIYAEALAAMRKYQGIEESEEVIFE